MEPELLFAIYAVMLIAVSIIGAYLPQMGNFRDNRTHMMISLSTGIFIGLLMFVLLPEAVEESEEGGIDTHYALMVVALGFLLIMIINILMNHKHIVTCGCHSEIHGHSLISASTFIGLSIHAACDGLALAAIFMTGEEMGLMATIGLCIHKFTELFSLSSTMLLTKMEKRKSMIRLGLFSLITPIAGALFFILFNGMEVEGTLGLPLAFAAGTLMYVTMCDMIPESFHRERSDLKSLVLILIGVGVMVSLALLFPHAH